jgi:hypothetical protein
MNGNSSNFIMSKKMKKAIENITAPYFSEKEQADMCFVMAIKLFKQGQEDLAIEFMAKALSTK